MGLTRRPALRLSTTALSLGVGGCIASPAPTTSASQVPSLRFSAHVLQQSSAESPVRVTAQLTNTGSQTTQIVRTCTPVYR